MAFSIGGLNFGGNNNTVNNDTNDTGSTSGTNGTSGDFLIACGGRSVPGVAVIGLGYNANSGDEVNQILRDAKEQNGGQPLNEVVMSFMGAEMSNIAEFAPSLVTDGDIKPGGTLAFTSGGDIPASDFQTAANNSGLRIVVQDEDGSGVTIYEKGKQPARDEDGTVSRGGLGTRSCGGTPGVNLGDSGTGGSTLVASGSNSSGGFGGFSFGSLI